MDREVTDPIDKRSPDERRLTREEQRRLYKRDYMRDYMRRRRAAASPAERRRHRAAWREYMRRRYADPIKGPHDRMKRRERDLKHSATRKRITPHEGDTRAIPE